MADEYANFSKLLADLDKAKKDAEEAEREESAARSRTTSARNHLTELQRKFDAVVAQMKKEAPRDSAWGQERVNPRREVVGL